MTRSLVAGIFLSLLALSAPASARDSALHLPIAEVVAPSYAQGKLDGSVRFFFADQASPAAISGYGVGISNRKTNAVNKSDAEACRWAMLAALIALQDQAKQRGANAVVGITSYYKRKEFSSADRYECHAGTFTTGVALKGNYVKVAAD